MDPGRAPQKRRWMTEKDPGCPFQERCFYLSVSSGPFSAFATISGQLHVSDWELDTDNMDPRGPVPARCEMIVSRYSAAPPSLKHSLLLVFVFVFIWKLTLKLLTKHLQNAQTYTRMRPKSYIDHATLQMAYHDEKVPEEKPASPPGSCRMTCTFVLGTSRSEGMLLHGESSDLLLSLQAWPPSHNSTAGSIRNLFIPSVVTLCLLWSNVLGPWDILVNTDSWPPGPWLLTGSRGLRKTESGACGFSSGEDKFTCNSITLWSVVCQKIWKYKQWLVLRGIWNRESWTTAEGDATAWSCEPLRLPRQQWTATLLNVQFTSIFTRERTLQTGSTVPEPSSKTTRVSVCQPDSTPLHSNTLGTRTSGNMFSLPVDRGREGTSGRTSGAFCAGPSSPQHEWHFPWGKALCPGRKLKRRSCQRSQGLSSQEITLRQKAIAALLFFWRKKKRTCPFSNL